MATKLAICPHLGLERHVIGFNADGLVHLEALSAFIFDNALASLARLLDMVKVEAGQWVMAGVHDLAALLPVVAAPSG